MKRALGLVAMGALVSTGCGRTTPVTSADVNVHRTGAAVVHYSGDGGAAIAFDSQQAARLCALPPAQGVRLLEAKLVSGANVDAGKGVTVDATLDSHSVETLSKLYEQTDRSLFLQFALYRLCESFSNKTFNGRCTPASTVFDLTLQQYTTARNAHRDAVELRKVLQASDRNRPTQHEVNNLGDDAKTALSGVKAAADALDACLDTCDGTLKQADEAVQAAARAAGKAKAAIEAANAVLAASNKVKALEAANAAQNAAQTNLDGAKERQEPKSELTRLQRELDHASEKLKLAKSAVTAEVTQEAAKHVPLQATATQEKEAAEDAKKAAETAVKRQSKCEDSLMDNYAAKFTHVLETSVKLHEIDRDLAKAEAEKAKAEAEKAKATAESDKAKAASAQATKDLEEFKNKALEKLLAGDKKEEPKKDEKKE